jgi:hypothetical protein
LSSKSRTLIAAVRGRARAPAPVFQWPQRRMAALHVHSGETAGHDAPLPHAGSDLFSDRPQPPLRSIGGSVLDARPGKVAGKESGTGSILLLCPPKTGQDRYAKKPASGVSADKGGSSCGRQSRCCHRRRRRARFRDRWATQRPGRRGAGYGPEGEGLRDCAAERKSCGEIVVHPANITDPAAVKGLIQATIDR